MMSTLQGTYVRIEQTSEAIREKDGQGVQRRGSRELELRTADLNKLKGTFVN